MQQHDDYKDNYLYYAFLEMLICTHKRVAICFKLAHFFKHHLICQFIYRENFNNLVRYDFFVHVIYIKFLIF